MKITDPKTPERSVPMLRLPKHAKKHTHPLKTRLAVIAAAELAGVTATQDATGISRQTIRFWMDQPEYAAYRTRLREDLREEITVVAHLAWQRVAESLYNRTLEPRDALFAAEKATVQYLLLSGEATSRTESKKLTDGLDDTEKQRLRDWIDSLAATGTPAPGASG